MRTGILSGTIPAGARMRTNDLCAQFHVSLGAVREALSQLLAQGLVVSVAHRGFTVSPVSPEDLLDLTRVRINIENLCLTWAIQAGTVEWESTIIASMHRLSRTQRLDERGRASAEWTDAHNKYHLALLSTCDSPRLMQMRHQLYEQSERYRNLEHSLPVNRHPEGEHQKLAEAALARDIALATRCMAEHLNLTANNVLKSMPGHCAPRRPKSMQKRDGSVRASPAVPRRPARPPGTGRSAK
ncbi:MAG: FCD domain-containing protein [Pseudomonadota bacterium]|nr:FCD domain-containing protein [Pseudomonadota bacterium]